MQCEDIHMDEEFVGKGSSLCANLRKTEAWNLIGSDCSLSHKTDIPKTNQEKRVRQKVETADELCMDLRIDGLALVENSGNTRNEDAHADPHVRGETY